MLFRFTTFIIDTKDYTMSYMMADLLISGLNANNDYGYNNVSSCHEIKNNASNRLELIYKSIVMFDIAVKVASKLKLNKKRIFVRMSGSLDCVKLENNSAVIRIDIFEGAMSGFSVSDMDNKLDFDSLDDMFNDEIVLKIVKEMNKKY